MLLWYVGAEQTQVAVLTRVRSQSSQATDLPTATSA